MRIHVNRTVALVVLGVGVLAFAVRIGWKARADPVADAAATRTLMDAESRELLQVSVEDCRDGFPVANPKTGRPTLYPTEVCRSEMCAAQGGTHVILNAYLGKEGPTYCPVCGAEVRFHNAGRD